MSRVADQETTPSSKQSGVYRARNKIRFVTAASLFDGHDASINIIRRLLQASGAEVIHLGHNRSVGEVAKAAIQEDVQGVALSSYQGGHIEYFKYLKDLLAESGAGHIRIFGGGGGVIVPEEIRELEAYGITRIFSPGDGRRLGLQGMINEMLQLSDFDICEGARPEALEAGHEIGLARLLSYLENKDASFADKLPTGRRVPVVGITGPGGAGKSSLTDELALRFLETNPDKKMAVLAMDPTRRKTGGALLGDRIRMNTPALYPDRIFVRSVATRSGSGSVSKVLEPALRALAGSGFDLILVETSGTGQSDADISSKVDLSIYVMTAEFGAPTQLEKIAMLDYADLIALNKSEKSGSQDALTYVQKQYQRNHTLFDHPVDSMPVLPTMASRFNDAGTSRLYNALIEKLERGAGPSFARIDAAVIAAGCDPSADIIPASRSRYLSGVADSIRRYHAECASQAEIAHKAQALSDSARQLAGVPETAALLAKEAERIRAGLNSDAATFLNDWPQTVEIYSQDELSLQIRGTELKQSLHETTLSGTRLPLTALPPYKSHGELTRFFYKENLPGRFPFTAGTFPFRRADEAPTRMFAGEGGPERTNVRFHYLAGGQGARLSTAFDSVTLYGENPARRPDIYGKIGNSGVSVPSLDDAKRLYSGFDLCHANTSVSMTINGPAPMILAFFFNTAVDQEVERHLAAQGKLEEARRTVERFYAERSLPSPAYRGTLPDGHNMLGLRLLGLPGDRFVDAEVYNKIKTSVFSRLRGTVQADILKEDQAQNTCIFSTGFALRMMGDVQQFFVQNRVTNFYSVSISGYHIAEAGANPITQLAFTLANGFTYAEYYLSRGMKIDDFAPNFSFFFSNGLDAEYSVIGRVARRIWAVAMKRLYGASERSQKLKYHIQTSGRSLHAMEVDFNDIRTTLQALYALYDNCNSLHTNAYDEAITTPTENSVRRALAIQLIINKELGLNKNQNSLQGSYIIEQLTDLVEEAVMMEFDRLTERGGVLGAMETMYQRSRIQEESLHYEELKHSGELPIIGVNTFLGSAPAGHTTSELIRSTSDEKEAQITGIELCKSAFADIAPERLARLKGTALRGENIFAELFEAAKYCTLGDLSAALYAVGGSYRRNM